MSYLVLARKYRPQVLTELVGQAHITDLLRKSVDAKRLAHAFLFCGPRGIGKTSCARILAKSLNCQEGPTVVPCGKCFACQEIANGNSFDVIEIDGASNRGIDEIRTLRENVKFAPAYGRYKIYIVDEVHMLTSEAFNALLKTLEEPPEYVKFIFATTEANKVPATILSRCQRFDFKRISVESIMDNLKGICLKEELKIDEDALFAIAKASQGSMRDALGILDQLSALGGEGIDAKDVYSMLGTVETELLFSLTDALIAQDCGAALKVFNDIIERGKDIKQLGKDLTEHFRHLMIVKIGGPALSDLVDYPAAIKQRLHKQTEKISVGDILKAIDLFIEAQETARIMETLRMPLELAFAKLSYKPSTAAPSMAGRPSPAKSAVTQSGKPVTSTPISPPTAPSMEPGPKSAAKGPSPESEQASIATASSITLEEIQTQWNAVTHDVSRQKMSVATYLQDGIPYAYKDGQLVIGFTKDHLFQKECLSANETLVLIEKVLSERFGTIILVKVKIIDGIPPKQEEPLVKNALEMFGGQVVKEWPEDVS
jgi:DNA polymerase III subunit gamma/tau